LTGLTCGAAAVTGRRTGRCSAVAAVRRQPRRPANGTCEPSVFSRYRLRDLEGSVSDFGRRSAKDSTRFPVSGNARLASEVSPKRYSIGMS
jgi:hypothetical protein